MTAKDVIKPAPLEYFDEGLFSGAEVLATFDDPNIPWTSEAAAVVREAVRRFGGTYQLVGFKFVMTITQPETGYRFKICADYGEASIDRTFELPAPGDVDTLRIGDMPIDKSKLEPGDEMTLHLWHSGQFSPVYSVASCLTAGKPVLVDKANEAIAELEGCITQAEDEDTDELQDVIDRLRRAVKGAVR